MQRAIDERDQYRQHAALRHRGLGPTGTGGRAARPPAGRPPTGDAPRPTPTASTTGVESAGSTLYVRAVLPSTDQTLTLSVDSSQVGATLNRLIVLEVVGGLVTLVVAAVLLVRLVGAALRPLDRMTALARRIGAGDRGRRLRTPLTGLAATTETLLRDEPGAVERERAYVTLVRETRRAGRLVDDLLTVTRLDKGCRWPPNRSTWPRSRPRNSPGCGCSPPR